MEEDVNYCCPFLNIVECAETDEHCHLCCATETMLTDSTITNERVKIWCLGNFEECKFYKAI